MKKLLPKTVNNPQGFTLVELLVVISIIAFLSVIGVTSFTNAQKQARDGRRRADIDAIAKAMESNFNALDGTYQALSEGFFTDGNFPKDPSTNVAYTATQTDWNKKFYTCAVLEISTGNFGPTDTAPASSGGCSLGAPALNNGWCYCRKSQQGG